MDSKKYFITGISTEVGKTIASAIITEALEADYWKPVQSGDLHFSDSDKVKSLISNHKSVLVAISYQVSWSSDCDISVQIKRLKASVQDLYVHGNLRLVLKPLLHSFPFIGGIQVICCQDKILKLKF